MDRRGTAAAVFFLFFVVADASNASLYGMIPDLADEARNNVSAVEEAVSPSPSPEPRVKEPDLKVENLEKSGNSAVKLDPEVYNGTVSAPAPAKSMTELSQKPDSSEKLTSESPPPKSFTDNGQNANPNLKDEDSDQKEKERGSGHTSIANYSKDTGKSNQTKGGEGNKNGDDRSQSPDNQIKGGDEKKKKNVNEDKTDLEPGRFETCKGMSSCDDHNSLIACIKGSERSEELVVLVENKGEESINVKVAVSTPMEYPLKELNIPKHETKRMNISVTSLKSGKLILSAGHGDCVLLLNPLAPKENFLHLPSYEKLLTPINGAYFLIAMVIIFAATWACCKFRKTTRHLDGIPYQELEMGKPDSISAEGWDKDWDDDWDEEHAVRSPSARISANGLTARSSNKDGWEDFWDD